jgi:hypothetical protein
MWRQFLDLPNLRGVTGTELTHLRFPSPIWDLRPPEERVSALVSWSATIQDPAGRLRLAREARRTFGETAAALSLRSDELDARGADLDLQIAGLRAAMAVVESSRVWRLRSRLLALRPVRALVARLPAAR